METPCLFIEGHRYAVAFSGGLDSTTLLALARQTPGVEVVAFLGVGVNFPAAEQREAEQYCLGNNIPLIKIPFDSLSIPEFRENVKDRCYFCKKALFALFQAEAYRLGLELVDGTNVDDLKDFRPGGRAAKELGVASPFLQAGMGKQEIRTLAKKLGLAIWDKPSMACLASRIPAGRQITQQALGTIDRVEEEIRQLGVRQVRVRWLADRNIRVELDFLRPELEGKIKKFIFAAFADVVQVDFAQYVSGWMNSVK